MYQSRECQFHPQPSQSPGSGISPHIPLWGDPAVPATPAACLSPVATLLRPWNDHPSAWTDHLASVVRDHHAFGIDNHQQMAPDWQNQELSIYGICEVSFLIGHHQSTGNGPLDTHLISPPGLSTPVKQSGSSTLLGTTMAKLPPNMFLIQFQ